MFQDDPTCKSAINPFKKVDTNIRTEEVEWGSILGDIGGQIQDFFLVKREALLFTNIVFMNYYMSADNIKTTLINLKNMNKLS